MFALPPPSPESAEGATAGEDVQGCGRLRDDAGRAEGGRGAERAQLEVSTEPGQGAERHPGFGDRVPRATDLWDLDEVVHQGDAREACLVRREGDTTQPFERVLAPGKA